MAETDLGAGAGAMTTSARAEAFAVWSGALVSAVSPIAFIVLAIVLAMTGVNAALVVIVGAMARRRHHHFRREPYVTIFRRVP
jgi:hypothetical protein